MSKRNVWFIILELTTVVNVLRFNSIFSILATIFSTILSILPLYNPSLSSGSVIFLGIVPLTLTLVAVNQDIARVTRSRELGWQPNGPRWWFGILFIPFLFGPLYIIMRQAKTNEFPGITGRLILFLVSNIQSDTPQVTKNNNSNTSSTDSSSSQTPRSSQKDRTSADQSTTDNGDSRRNVKSTKTFGDTGSNAEKTSTNVLESNMIPNRIPETPTQEVSYDSIIEEEKIGSGSNAEVTKATLSQIDGNETIAIKTPRMSGTLHTEEVKQLHSEAETWNELDNHDHIVGVVDFGEQPLPWIAMEYMDGGDLSERYHEMGVRQSLWTAIAVTKGVRFAHRRGVAHLDLKPKNILFRQINNSWDVPKIADWGLSKHLLKHPQTSKGLTPRYAAPEQFDDSHGSTDHLTDIYQLGAVFYELFTGQPPFSGKPATVMHRVLKDRPTPPSEVADVPSELDDILLTALEKDKSERFEDIVYLRDALQEIAAQQL